MALALFEAQATAPTVESATLNALQEALGSDGLEVLLGKVREDLMDALKASLGATRETDIATVRAQTYILIRITGTVGATDLQRSAEALNSRAHQTGDVAALVGDVAALAQEINALDAALDQPSTSRRASKLSNWPHKNQTPPYRRHGNPLHAL